MAFYCRKSPRLPEYNYASQNYYFITICTHEKKCIFGQPGNVNFAGKIAQSCLERIPDIYKGVFVDKLVVMPNHVHAIIAIDESDTPPLTQIVGQYKMSVTKKLHTHSGIDKVWQRSFHDHVIRNQQDYERIWLYIHGNPQEWIRDCFFLSDT